LQSFRELGSFKEAMETYDPVPTPDPKSKFLCNCGMDTTLIYACNKCLKWLDIGFSTGTYEYEKNKDAYEGLVEVSKNAEIVNRETEKQILVDVERTYQKSEFFVSQDMKDKLSRILKAIVVYDPSIGYMQGMNFIAASLSIH
jgi:hypothetical protein